MEGLNETGNEIVQTEEVLSITGVVEQANVFNTLLKLHVKSVIEENCPHRR